VAMQARITMQSMNVTRCSPTAIDLSELCATHHLWRPSCAIAYT
jgi:hypothetical protein